MKFFSIVMLTLLTGCGAILKNEREIKKFGHDVVDEQVDQVITSAEEAEKK